MNATRLDSLGLRVILNRLKVIENRTRFQKISIPMTNELLVFLNILGSHPFQHMFSSQYLQKITSDVQRRNKEVIQRIWSVFCVVHGASLLSGLCGEEERQEILVLIKSHLCKMKSFDERHLFIDAWIKIPRDKRSSVLTYLERLILGFEDIGAKHLLVSKIAHIPDPIRPIVCDHAHLFIHKAISSKDVNCILTALSRIPDFLISPLCANLIQLPLHFLSGHEIASILTEFKRMNPTHFAPAAKFLQQCLERTKIKQGYGPLIWDFLRYNRNHWMHISSYVFFHTSWLQSPHQLTQLIHLWFSISLEDIDSVQNAFSCIKINKGWRGGFSKILKIIYELPRQDRLEIACAVSSYVEKAFSADEAAYIFQCFLCIPKDRRALISSLGSNFIRSYGMPDIFMTLLHIPLCEVDRVCYWTKKYSSSDFSSPQIVSLIKCLTSFSLDQREEICQSAQILLVDVPCVEYTMQLLNLISRCPAQERGQICELTSRFSLAGKEFSWLKDGLEAIARVARDERVELVSMCVDFLQHSSSWVGVDMLIEKLNLIPTGQRKEVLGELAPFLLKDIFNSELPVDLKKNTIEKYIDVMDLLAKGDKKGMFVTLLPYTRILVHSEAIALTSLVSSWWALRGPSGLENLWDLLMCLRKEEISSMLACLKYFPIHSLERAILMFQSEKQKGIYLGVNPLSLIFFLVHTQESMRQELHEHLLYRLKTIRHFREARQLSQDLFYNSHFFLVLEGTPLHQEMITVLANTSDPTNPKNPYRIFQILLSYTQKDVLIESMVVPTEEIEGSIVALHPSSLKIPCKGHIESKEVLALCRNVQIHKQTLVNLVDRMMGRINELPEEEQINISLYVQKMTGSCFSMLCENFKDTTMQSFLEGPMEGQVPFTYAYFVSILRFLLDCDSSVVEGQMLSTQEECILKFSESIQNCRTGKQHGIYEVYQNLDSRYKYSLPILEVKDSSHSTAYEFVRDVFIDYLSSLVNSPSEFMEEVTGFSGVNLTAQFVHQSMYVKNLLCSHISLPHQLEFDAYTGCISNELLGKTLDQVLRVFIDFISIQTLIQKIRDQIQSFPLEKRRALFNSINALLDPKVALEDVWHLTDQAEPGGLTIQGAVALLKATSILSVVPWEITMMHLLGSLMLQMQQQSVLLSVINILPQKLYESVLWHYQPSSSGVYNESHPFFDQVADPDIKTRLSALMKCGSLMLRDVFKKNSLRVAGQVFIKMPPVFKKPILKCFGDLANIEENIAELFLAEMQMGFSDTLLDHLRYSAIEKAFKEFF